MEKRKLCELRKELINDKQMQVILEATIGATDTRPKNNYIIKCKPFYKEYIKQQYEYK